MPLPFSLTSASSDELLDPNELVHEIRFESPVLDDAGEKTDDWNDEGVEWAKIEPLAGRKLFLALQSDSRITHEITVAWREGVQPDWRIVFKERVFYIERVMNILELDVKLEIMAIEKPQPKI